jgi:beta-xylosidase
MDWEPVCRAVAEYESSGMIPDLVKYKGKYYIYYPAANTNWVVWAGNIKGQWSKLIDWSQPVSTAMPFRAGL